jgi:hypothetical protein
MPITSAPAAVSTIHVERWICRKADGWYSYGSFPASEVRCAMTAFGHVGTPGTTTEPHQVWLRRQWWAVRSLIEISFRLADRCPHVADGTAALMVFVRENEITVDHQGVNLRILYALCPSCLPALGSDLPRDEITSAAVPARPTESGEFDDPT